MLDLNLKELESILRPPGNGVFTVKTAEDVIQSVQTEIYGESDKTKFIKSGKIVCLQFHMRIFLCS